MSTAIRIDCPVWCCDSARHSVDDVMTSTDGRIIIGHSGPQFGPWSAGSDTDISTGKTVELSVAFDEVVLKERGYFISEPDVLRRIASEALAAAEWLEANR